MPVDVESELARLGKAWTASVAHVDVAEVLERAMTTRSEPLDVEEFDVTVEPPRHRWTVLVVAAMVASVAAILVVISREDGTGPVETPTSIPTAPTPLEEPSRDEAELASNEEVYMTGSGHTEVTGTRGYVSLRRCDPRRTDFAGGCDGTEGWAYLTGGADSPEVHYGLLGMADYLTVSALDDRLFVASAPSSTSQDPQSAPPAWLIDSVTGQRGPLRWQEQPVTLNSPEQTLVLFPAHPNTYDREDDPSFERFLPRVVDTRDWTIRPLSVPDDATAMLSIHQLGLDRIWIGTAPDGGDFGLAYTDDGGASWTEVEVPPSLRHTSDVLVAAAGDHVAVTRPWGGATEVFVSTDAGETWNTVHVDPPSNGTEVFVLADGRLMVVFTTDADAEELLVSSSPSSTAAPPRPPGSDWSQLQPSAHSEVLAGVRSHINVNQQGIVVDYLLSGGGATFSTDLNDWWTIPGLPHSFTP